MGKIYIFSGQMCSGKDYVAEKAGIQPLSIAEPMYRIAEHYMGSSDKTRPEIRRFLQVVGMWGRGEGKDVASDVVSLDNIAGDLRQNGRLITGMRMAWGSFAKDGNFWLQGALDRATTTMESGGLVGVVNGRFKNEIDAFKAIGADHYHVMCNEASRRMRMKRDFDPTIDMEGTERMSYEYSQSAREGGAEAIQATAVVWNDTKPSGVPRALTLSDFVARVKDENTMGLPGRFSSPEGPAARGRGRPHEAYGR